MEPRPRAELLVAPRSLPRYLLPDQLTALTRVFEAWFEAPRTPGRRRLRGRYWLVYLVLRYTGARLGEVLRLDDRQDLDFRAAEIRMPTLKRRQPATRQVFVPARLMAEIATYLAEFPEMRGRCFRLDPGNFRRLFRRLALEAHLPPELAHPHVLRHTRAVELLRAGVPVTIVQDQLGHASLLTTALYLRLSGQEAKLILRDRGLL